MKPTDKPYLNLPWKDGGRTRAGVDCVGLAVLWLEAHFNFRAPVPADRPAGRATELLRDRNFHPAQLERGDVVFLADRAGQIRHVGVWLGGGKLLHTLRGFSSRADNGFTLVQRLGLKPVAAVKPEEAEVLSEALADQQVGDVTTAVYFAISVALSVASALLMPKLARFGNKYGRYGFDALVTQTSTEIPLPDVLGAVVLAGNSPYTQLSDKNVSATATAQRANKIIIFSSAEAEGLDLDRVSLTINGLSYSDKYWKNTAAVVGFVLDPEQTKAEAHTGTVQGQTNCPSISFYPGAPGTSVPVDIRASYDRTFPIYGFNGCCYAVFRLIDSTKFPQFNVTVRIKGRKCRTFDASGFVTSNEVYSEAADGTSVRFDLGGQEIKQINSVEVDSNAFTEMSAANQTGDVYSVNRTRGYVEFLTAPTAALVVDVDYDIYVRDWSENPAALILYLLTENGRGCGFDESMIDFASFVAARDYYDQSITWYNSNGVNTGKRYTANYAVDFRKPVQEHLRALLEACRSVLFLSNGQFVLKAIRDGSSVFSFDEDNILRDSFVSELLDRAERPNRIKAFYHSADTYNAETEVMREDAADQAERESRAGNGGVVEENLKFPAVDNQSQAERLAELHLRGQVAARWACSFKTTIQGIALEVGDVVDVTHSSQPTWAAKLFRVESTALGEDDRLELELGEYFEGVEI
jgi:cell wall-associated NlpC family hydrolase